MIQDRTFELLKNPKSIQAEDLQILEKDIKKYPYMQSIRALYLYGNHLYHHSAYNELLTLTAAYTTEKKILYQFIKQSVVSNQQTADSKQRTANSQEAERKEPTAENRPPKAESDVPPAISFDNNSDNILPNITIQPAPMEAPKYTPKPQIDKHQEEMKRLIAEVEAKMARNRLAKQQQEEQKHEEEYIGGEVNFSEVERIEDIDTQDIKEEISQSNIPSFINTWQSWLRLDKANSVIVSEKEQEENIEDIKNKAIETFIENNPKISKITREESDYSSRDKGDDISHLMTETLANLYVTQRLYAKAIHAFEVLGEKYPEKKKYFQERAQEVKDLRMGKHHNEE